jgi:hypothetical protein
MRNFIKDDATLEWDVRAYCRICDGRELLLDTAMVRHEIAGFRFHAMRSYSFVFFRTIYESFCERHAKRAREYPGPTPEEYRQRKHPQTGYTYFGHAGMQLDPFAPPYFAGGGMFDAFLGPAPARPIPAEPAPPGPAPTTAPAAAPTGNENQNQTDRRSRRQRHKYKPALRDLRAQDRANRKK